MALRIGINGFGRIGRNVLRASWNRDDVRCVHVNDLTSADMLAYLLQHDTVHGRWHDSAATPEGIRVGDRLLRVTAERDPSRLPWGDSEVDVVLECTGAFTDGQKAKAHLDAGARRVLISAPGKNVDGTFVFGVNHHELDPSTHRVVSNASCTTNCLAPVAKVLHDTVGIEHGLVTTIHSYTMDQNLLDAPHPGGKFRRARAAAANMVPTSTGAASAIGLVIPALKGKLDGMAMRVPTPNVSIVDLVATVQRDVAIDDVNGAFREAAAGALKGILAVTDQPVVSSDLNHDPHSAVVDLALTQVIGRRMVKVMAWYDNEWAFSNRMIDLALHLGRAG